MQGSGGTCTDGNLIIDFKTGYKKIRQEVASSLIFLRNLLYQYNRFLSFSTLFTMILPLLMSMSFSALKSLNVRIRDSVAVPTYWAMSSLEISIGFICSLRLNFPTISTRALAT